MIDPIVTTINLWQHQTQGIEYLKAHHGGLLMMGVGTGKTLTALEYIKQAGLQKVLIVGTKNSIYTWKKQVEDFGYEFAVQVFSESSVKDRALELSSFLREHGVRIAIINYEAASKGLMVAVLKRLSLDCILYDEVHRLRGYKSQQSKAAFQIAKDHPNATRIGLTGTVIYNRPLDVFGIMRFINKNIFGIYWTPFKERYATWRGQFNQIPVKYINQEELRSKVINNSFIVDRHKVLDLPSEQHIEVRFSFDKKQKQVYNTFNREYVTELNEVVVSAKNILDKVNKLQQLTGGFIYQDKEAISFSDVKLNALESILEDTDENIIVFYKFAAELSLIRNTCEKLSRHCFSISGAGSQYSEWLTFVESSVFAVQISSGSEGIDLTKAAITVFYDGVYSYGQYEQAKGRTSRPNQQAASVLYYYLICSNTVDETIMEALKKKKDLIEFLTDNS